MDISGIAKENLNRDDEIYSPIYGVGLFEEVNNRGEIECKFPIMEFNPYVMIHKDIRNFRKFDYVKFDREGRCEIYDQHGKKFTTHECMLFPSHDERNWYNVRKDLPRGTIVVVSKDDANHWEVRKYDGRGRIVGNSIDEAYDEYDYIIPFDKFDYNHISASTKYNYAKGHHSVGSDVDIQQTIQ